MKLAIIGSRDFEDYDFMKECFEGFVALRGGPPDMLVSGGAKGADSLARRLAEEKGIPFHEIDADWKKFGRAAGPIRNKQLVEFSDGALAFPLGLSKGTRGCVKLFHAAKKMAKVFERAV